MAQYEDNVTWCDGCFREDSDVTLGIFFISEPRYRITVAMGCYKNYLYNSA